MPKSDFAFGILVGVQEPGPAAGFGGRPDPAAEVDRHAERGGRAGDAAQVAVQAFARGDVADLPGRGARGRRGRWIIDAFLADPDAGAARFAVHAEDRFPVAEIEVGQRPGRGLGGGGGRRPRGGRSRRSGGAIRRTAETFYRPARRISRLGADVQIFTLARRAPITPMWTLHSVRMRLTPQTRRSPACCALACLLLLLRCSRRPRRPRRRGRPRTRPTRAKRSKPPRSPPPPRKPKPRASPRPAACRSPAPDRPRRPGDPGGRTGGRPGLGAARRQAGDRRRQPHPHHPIYMGRRARQLRIDRGYDCSGSVSYALHGGEAARIAARLRLLHDLGRTRSRQVDHDLRQQGTRLHDGRRPALRHRRRPARRHRAPLARRTVLSPRASSSAIRSASERPPAR